MASCSLRRCPTLRRSRFNQRDKTAKQLADETPDLYSLLPAQRPADVAACYPRKRVVSDIMMRSGTVRLLVAAYTAGAAVGGTQAAPAGRVFAEKASSNDTLFVASYENAGPEESWADQELSCGQPFRKGDVPAGTLV